MTRPAVWSAREARAAALALALFATLCAAATDAADDREVVDPAAMRRAAAEPQVAERMQRIDALAAAGAVDPLSLEIQRTLDDPQLGAVARELLLDRALHALATGKPTVFARALVGVVASRPAQVFTVADPEHGERAVPAFDPAATARFVLTAWSRAAARDDALAKLRAGSAAPIERFAATVGGSEADALGAGIVDAFAQASVQTLMRHRASVIAALERGERVDEIAGVLALRLRDAELVRLLVDYADAAVALRTVQRVRATLDDGAALQALTAASHRPEIASAAILEIGHLSAQTPGARQFLFEQFDDPALAPSAASALAALHDASVAAQLGDKLRAAQHEPRRRMLALALQLDGSSAARAELARFSQTGAGSVQLRQEVRAWLAR